MIDVRYILNNKEEIFKNIKNRNSKANLNLFISLFEKRSELLKNIENLRKLRNDNAKELKQNANKDNKSEIIEKGKVLKEKLTILESDLSILEKEYLKELKEFPNLSHQDSPLGKEEDFKELYKVGNPPNFDFIPLSHEELGTHLDIIDFINGAKVTGNKFYFLKNEAVFLELALIKYTFDILLKHNFTPIITPDLAKNDIIEGLGFNPRNDQEEIYTINNSELSLIGTSEITLGGYYANSLINKKDLPIKLSGLSHCFRKEAGSYGKFSKGLYRVHQFTKIEMFIICSPEESEKMHQEILKIEEEILDSLNLAYRVIDIPRGDLGASAYRKFDIEVWIPSREDNNKNLGAYGEITSASNCTDYQARRLNIKYKDKEKKGYVNTLNGTAIPISRILIAIIENYQTQDKKVDIPEVLHPYLNFKKIERS